MLTSFTSDETFLKIKAPQGGVRIPRNLAISPPPDGTFRFREQGK